jgi:hypothetical protein
VCRAEEKDSTSTVPDPPQIEQAKGPFLPLPSHAVQVSITRIGLDYSRLSLAMCVSSREKDNREMIPTDNGERDVGGQLA